MHGKDRANAEPDSTAQVGQQFTVAIRLGSAYALPVVNYFQARRSGKELSYFVFYCFDVISSIFIFILPLPLFCPSKVSRGQWAFIHQRISSTP